MRRMMIVLAAALWGCVEYSVDPEKVQIVGEDGEDAIYETDTDHELEPETEATCTVWCVRVNLEFYHMTDVRGPNEGWDWNWDSPTIIPTAPEVTIDPGPPMIYEACSTEPFSIWVHAATNPWRGWQSVTTGLIMPIPIDDLDQYLPDSFIRQLNRRGMLGFNHFAVIAAECVEGLEPNAGATLPATPPISWFIIDPPTFPAAANTTPGSTPPPQLVR